MRKFLFVLLVLMAGVLSVSAEPFHSPGKSSRETVLSEEVAMAPSVAFSDSILVQLQPMIIVVSDGYGVATPDTVDTGGMRTLSRITREKVDAAMAPNEAKMLAATSPKVITAWVIQSFSTLLTLETNQMKTWFTQQPDFYLRC